MNLLTRLFRIKKPTEEKSRHDEIIRKAAIIESAEKGEFHAVLMDEIALMHEWYLNNSVHNPSLAVGAQSLLQLTRRLHGFIALRDKILIAATRSEEKELDRLEKELMQDFAPSRSEPHLIS